MIACTRCGFENQDSATFCRSCGGFLEWSGKRVEEQPPPEAEAGPAEEPAPAPVVAAPGIVTRVRDRIGGGAAERGTTLSPPMPPETTGEQFQSENGSSVDEGEPVTGVIQATPSDVAAISQPRTEEEQAVSESTADGATGDAGQPPPARHPEAVPPQAVAQRPKIRVAPPAEDLQVGDLICGQCGAGNAPSRRFCRKCAASLEDAIVFHQSRWQRFLQRRRDRKIRPAGSRPGVSRHGVKRPGWLTSWVTKVVMAAVVLFAIAASVGPFSKTIRSHVSWWSHDVRTFFHPTYTPVHPVSASASSISFGHQASLAIDGSTNTSWETNDGNNGIGQSITVTFSKPVNLAEIGVLNGDQNGSQTYLSEARPQLVHLAFNGSPATSQDLTFADVSSFQTFGISSHHTTSVVLTIVSSYPSPVGHNAAIAELEFFTKER